MQIKIKAAGSGDSGPELTGARVRVIDVLDALSQQIPSSIDVDISRMVGRHRQCGAFRQYGHLQHRGRHEGATGRTPKCFSEV
jgi:hypothetical protein